MFKVHSDCNSIRTQKLFVTLTEKGIHDGKQNVGNPYGVAFDQA